ncbi:BLUF domain-containing protein [Aurantimonas sp. A2-1-M11]|uniref:BLUF domain-containing protein n=1 Tax=Aurantimonas sp. A2-1-M11 TaxID=3113712 RepID=UPI002F951723
MYRLTYFSENHLDYRNNEAREGIGRILDKSRENNRRMLLTGALILDNLWFIQSIEGDRQHVWRTFQSIYADNRHHNVVIAQAGDVEGRLFGEWSMAFATRTAETATIFDAHSHGNRINPTLMSAKNLLELLQKTAASNVSPFLSAV